MPQIFGAFSVKKKKNFACILFHFSLVQMEKSGQKQTLPETKTKKNDAENEKKKRNEFQAIDQNENK